MACNCPSWILVVLLRLCKRQAAGIAKNDFVKFTPQMQASKSDNCLLSVLSIFPMTAKSEINLFCRFFFILVVATDNRGLRGAVLACSSRLEESSFSCSSLSSSSMKKPSLASATWPTLQPGGLRSRCLCSSFPP